MIEIIKKLEKIGTVKVLSEKNGIFCLLLTGEGIPVHSTAILNICSKACSFENPIIEIVKTDYEYALIVLTPSK